MNHIAIDLGSKESQVCVRQPDGTIVSERKYPTRHLRQHLQTLEHSRVIVETSSEAFAVADAARAAGHEVRVVPATLAKQLGVGERKTKTDLRDARKLSEVSCRIDLPSVHVPSTEGRELRALLRARQTLISCRTQLVNHVRGWFRAQLGTLRSRWSSRSVPRLRDAMHQRGLTLPVHIDQVLSALEAVNTQVKDSTAAIHARANANPVCQRLMSVPGIGPISALAFVASIDDVSRFAHAHRVQAYLGLTPGEHSSAESQRRTSITKAGPSIVRFTLVQAAWVVLRKYPNDPMSQWAQQIVKRRGARIAAVALARKLSAVMFALWRDQSTYVARKSASVKNPEAVLEL